MKHNKYYLLIFTGIFLVPFFTSAFSSNENLLAALRPEGLITQEERTDANSDLDYVLHDNCQREARKGDYICSYKTTLVAAAPLCALSRTHSHLVCRRYARGDTMTLYCSTRHDVRGGPSQHDEKGEWEKKGSQYKCVAE